MCILIWDTGPSTIWDHTTCSFYSYTLSVMTVKVLERYCKFWAKDLSNTVFPPLAPLADSVPDTMMQQAQNISKESLRGHYIKHYIKHHCVYFDGIYRTVTTMPDIGIISLHWIECVLCLSLQGFFWISSVCVYNIAYSGSSIVQFLTFFHNWFIACWCQQYWKVIAQSCTKITSVVLWPMHIVWS